MNENRKKRKKEPPKLLRPIIEQFFAFVDWIAPVVDWVGDQAERYRAASDAVPPPSRRWVHRRRLNSRNLTVTLFLLFLAVMSGFALYLPNRPSHSELENRDLTPFPRASVLRVLGGAWFDDINTWFADTFPAREGFLAFQSWAEGHYGFRSRTITGAIVKGEEIPDENPVRPAAAEASAGDASDAAAQSPQSGAAGSAAQSSTAQADGSAQQADAQSTQTADTSAQPEQKPETAEQPQETLRKGESDSGDDGAAAETLGTVLIIRHSAYEYYNFVRELADGYCANLNRAAELLRGKAKVYSMVVPTSMDVCVSEKARKKIDTSDQAKAIRYLYDGMSEDITTVPLIDSLREHQAKDEYLYFRTDHHWTALGAYVAYQNFMSAAGKQALPLSHFRESVSEDFVGSFYRETKSADLSSKPDTVYAYAPKGAKKVQFVQNNGKKGEERIIRDGEEFSRAYKYLLFVGGDQPFSVIENSHIEDGSSILVVKDSFGNCFCPYLVDSYAKVYMIDYRSFRKVDERSLAQVVDEYGIGEVLFLNNISGTREEKLNEQMKNFIG